MRARFPKEIACRYEYVKHIQQGVYLAIDLQSNEKVVVKIVDKDLLAENEENILSRLDHPKIVRLLDCVKLPNETYLVMEYASGGELFDRLVKKTVYMESDAREVVRQVLEGLAYLHENNIAHRDIKAENILLESQDNDTRIKIADFGISKEVVGIELNSKVGTKHYMAPEILERRPYGLAADMWSVGVLTFTLLCGNYPFGGKHWERKVVAASYSFSSPNWTHVSSDAKDFVTKLLEIDCNKRLTVTQAMSHPWIDRSDVSDLMTHDLSASIADMRVTFPNKWKWKRIFFAITITNFLKKSHKMKLAEPTLNESIARTATAGETWKDNEGCTTDDGNTGDCNESVAERAVTDDSAI